MTTAFRPVLGVSLLGFGAMSGVFGAEASSFGDTHVRGCELLDTDSPLFFLPCGEERWEFPKSGPPIKTSNGRALYNNKDTHRKGTEFMETQMGDAWQA